MLQTQEIQIQGKVSCTNVCRLGPAVLPLPWAGGTKSHLIL